MIAILKKLQKPKRDGGFVIPGLKEDKQLSDGAMLMRLERMNRGDITVHGFRSAFKDWALECTDLAPEVSEMALAHVVEDKVEAAYRRGDLLRKRRALMQMWARHVEGKSKQLGWCDGRASAGNQRRCCWPAGRAED